MTPFETCAALAHQLEADWGHGRKAMRGRHGEATKHFALHVKDGVIEIRCLTPIAFNWHAITKAAKIGLGSIIPVHRVQSWKATP